MTIFNKSALNLIEIASTLGPQRTGSRGWVQMCCPFHDEVEPSFFVNESRFRCFGCGERGDVYDFCQRLWGMGAREVNESFGTVVHGALAPKITPPTKRQPTPLCRGTERQAFSALVNHAHHNGWGTVGLYRYRDASGTLLFIKGKFYKRRENTKTFRSIHPVGDAWFWGENQTAPKTLYARSIHAPHIVIVEGEACVDRITDAAPLVGAVTAGSASDVAAYDWTPILGAETIMLWPDNDRPGFRAMESVGKILLDLGRPSNSIYCIDKLFLVEHPKKADACDLVTGTLDEQRIVLREILRKQAELWTPGYYVDGGANK